MPVLYRRQGKKWKYFISSVYFSLYFGEINYINPEVVEGLKFSFAEMLNVYASLSLPLVALR